MNAFILYEFDFDPNIFKKYYDDINSPGVYAIPEDSVNPQSIDNNIDNDNEIQQTFQDRQQVDQQLQNFQPIQQQISQDEQQAFNYEVEGIKKKFILDKLENLSNFLKSKFLSNSDLELILKYGTFLSYRTLQILAINFLNHLKQDVDLQVQKDAALQNQNNIEEPISAAE